MAELEGEESQSPRIIKKKHVHGGHHGGSWKVAYADFVTAMMALFIVLWIMSQSQSIRNNVSQYFKNPGVLKGSSGIMETSGMSGEIPTPGRSLELQTPAPIPAKIDQEKAALEEARTRINEMIAQLPDLKTLMDQIHLKITGEGLRIELMEKQNSLFFDVGSATPKPWTQELFKVIAQELTKLPNEVAIEGHTDSRPYGGKHYTNWELSVDRANAARRVMVDNGLNPDQLFEVRGYADKLPINPEDKLDFKNRRVSIIVLYKDKVKTGSLEPPMETSKQDAPAAGATPMETSKKDAPAAGATPALPPQHPETSKKALLFPAD